MTNVWEEVGRWALRGDRIAIAMVVGAERSAPRMGAKLFVTPDGDRLGSLGSAPRERALPRT
jgi:xanthine/CO dehydrogenase XdhC/CoxF family maturation factor